MLRINLISPEPGGPCFMPEGYRYYPIFVYPRDSNGKMYCVKLEWKLRNTLPCMIDAINISKSN